MAFEKIGKSFNRKFGLRDEMENGIWTTDGSGDHLWVVGPGNAVVYIDESFATLESSSWLTKTDFSGGAGTAAVTGGICEVNSTLVNNAGITMYWHETLPYTLREAGKITLEFWGKWHEKLAEMFIGFYNGTLSTTDEIIADYWEGIKCGKESSVTNQLSSEYSDGAESDIWLADTYARIKVIIQDATTPTMTATVNGAAWLGGALSLPASHRDFNFTPCVRCKATIAGEGQLFIDWLKVKFG